MTPLDDQPLHPGDAAALDALIEAGFDLDAMSGAPDELRERAANIARLMGLLDALPDEAHADDLVARTMQAVLSTRTDSADVDVDEAAPIDEQVELATLNAADAAALDALVDSGFDSDALPDEHRDGAERVSAVLGLLNTLPDESTGDLLVPRTLQAVEADRRERRLGRQIEQLASGDMGRGGLRLSELGAVAAMVLIGLSVLWPMLNKAATDARQIACQANLATAGMAMGDYAADFSGALPATAARLGDSWWQTNTFNEDGTARSNSAHLYVLVNDKYVKIADLACPSNLHAINTPTPDARDWPTTDAISYSYQNQYTTDKPRYGQGPRIAVLADKNPFFGRGSYRMELCSKKRDANSANHAAGVGQNVLMTDGSVQWLATPRLDNEDNIYHVGIDGFDNYTGLEGPADESDSFLVP